MVNDDMMVMVIVMVNVINDQIVNVMLIEDNVVVDDLDDNVGHY